MTEGCKIIQLSDLHVDAFNPTAAAQIERLRIAVRTIRADHADCDLVVVTGDIADDGHQQSYVLAREALGDLDVPIVPMVGNHDRRAALRAVFPETPDDGAGFVQTRLRVGPAEILILDTLHDGSEAGLLCPDRLAWLSRQLSEPASGRRLVFMHHPPLSVGVPWLDEIKLQNPEMLRALISTPKGAPALFAGHVHMDVAVCEAGLTMFTTRGLARAFGAAPDGERPFPPGIRVIEVNAAGELTVRTEPLPDPA